VLAEEGCDVVLVARTAADLEAVRAKIIGKHNVAVRFYPLDLSDSRNVDKLAAECPDIDILINNAGAIRSSHYNRFPAPRRPRFPILLIALRGGATRVQGAGRSYPWRPGNAARGRASRPLEQRG
jgi:NAD(P)-dependent dehydrogenase (short-subunit alcohol dehydrogenase family)